MNHIKKKPSPTISVLMCVRNEDVWVSQAIESVLDQTYSDFELIITDDGSSDNTSGVLQHYSTIDDRIQIIQHTASLGLASSLNEQIQIARGRYLARMDGDDIAQSDRFAKQVEFMDEHPQVGLLGSFCREINSEGNPIGVWERPTSDRALKKTLFSRNPFIHSSVMLRCEVFSVVGLYNESMQFAQDYELWLRVAGHFDLANLSEPLIDLRVDWSKLTKKNRRARRYELIILLHYIRSEGFPIWYYFYLLRPFLLSLLPTGVTMKMKSIQRRLRQKKSL